MPRNGKLMIGITFTSHTRPNMCTTWLATAPCILFMFLLLFGCQGLGCVHQLLENMHCDGQQVYVRTTTC